MQLVLGQIFTIPAGTSLQVDGSYHVQTSRRQKNPCNPNPCSKVKKSVCEAVGPTTAKCSQIAGVDTGYDYCCDCSSDDETFCSDDGLNCDCDYCQFNALNACSNPDICEGCTGVDTGYDYCCNCVDEDPCYDYGLDCDCDYWSFYPDYCLYSCYY